MSRYDHWDDNGVGCLAVIMFILGMLFMNWWLS